MGATGSHPQLDQGECAFCAIALGLDASARIVYRDDNVVAFFPTEPATIGHTLVVPRTHIADVWALDGPTTRHLADVTLLLAGAVRDVLAPEGLNIIQSNGEAATQTVPHLHIHLVPRWAGDQIGPIWPDQTDYSEDAKDAAWQAIVRKVSSSAREAEPDEQDQSCSDHRSVKP